MSMFKSLEFMTKMFEVKPKDKEEYDTMLAKVNDFFKKDNTTIIPDGTDGDLEFAKKEFYQKIAKLRSEKAGNACLKSFNVLNLFIKYAKWDFFPTFGYPKIYYEISDGSIILRWIRTKMRTVDVILSDNPIIFRIEDDNGNVSHLYSLLYYNFDLDQTGGVDDASVLKSEYEAIRALKWDKIYTDDNSIKKASFRFDIDIENNKDGDGILLTVKIPDTALQVLPSNDMGERSVTFRSIQDTDMSPHLKDLTSKQSVINKSDTTTNRADLDIIENKDMFYNELKNLRITHNHTIGREVFSKLNKFIRYAKWDFFQTFGYPEIYFNEQCQNVVLKWVRNKKYVYFIAYCKNLYVIIDNCGIVQFLTNSDSCHDKFDTLFVNIDTISKSYSKLKESKDDANVLKAEFNKIRALEWDKIYTDRHLEN